jgi:hypothetical protein
MQYVGQNVVEILPMFIEENEIVPIPNAPLPLSYPSPS